MLSNDPRRPNRDAKQSAEKQKQNDDESRVSLFAWFHSSRWKIVKRIPIAWRKKDYDSLLMASWVVSITFRLCHDCGRLSARLVPCRRPSAQAIKIMQRNGEPSDKSAKRWCFRRSIAIIFNEMLETLFNERREFVAKRFSVRDRKSCCHFDKLGTRHSPLDAVEGCARLFIKVIHFKPPPPCRHQASRLKAFSTRSAACFRSPLLTQASRWFILVNRWQIS